VTASLAGPVSTGSSSPVDLGGPSVTVNVGPSGLVAYWARGELKSVGGGEAEIALIDKGFAPQLTTPANFYVQLHTEPGSDSGTNVFNTGLSTDYVGPGKQTLKLEYLDSGGTGFFQEVELVVIPL
jgi:hypothetical protein